MRRMKVFLGIFIFLMSSSLSFGQEMKAEKYENPQWVSISSIKFKPMKKDPAMIIIENYFAKADEDAGIDPPVVYNFPMGKYDMMVIWDMEEGLETLNWKTTPDDVKWMKSMAKLAGGQDKAIAKLEEFMSYIDSWDHNIARKD